DHEPEFAEIVGQPIRHGALVPRDRLDLAQPYEVVDEAQVARACSTTGSSSGAAIVRPPARSTAAPTKSRNSGCGRSGRDLNSGWYWEATKNGWWGSSIASTSRSSGEVPEQTRPACSSRLRRWLLTS